MRVKEGVKAQIRLTVRGKRAKSTRTCPTAGLTDLSRSFWVCCETSLKPVTSALNTVSFDVPLGLMESLLHSRCRQSLLREAAKILNGWLTELMVAVSLSSNQVS